MQTWSRCIPLLWKRSNGQRHDLAASTCVLSLYSDKGSAFILKAARKLGASCEGFAMEEITRAQKPEQVHFYGVHSGSELDLLLVVAGQRIAFTSVLWPIVFPRKVECERRSETEDAVGKRGVKLG